MRFLLATLVAVVPPEPDLYSVCLRADAVLATCRVVSEFLSVAAFEVQAPAAYDAVAVDFAGNVSVPSNVIRLNDTRDGDVDGDGDMDLLDSVLMRRRLAGLE